MEIEKSKVLTQFLLIFRQSGDVLFFLYARRLRGYTATDCNKPDATTFKIEQSFMNASFGSTFGTIIGKQSYGNEHLSNKFSLNNFRNSVKNAHIPTFGYHFPRKKQITSNVFLIEDSVFNSLNFCKGPKNFRKNPNIQASCFFQNVYNKVFPGGSTWNDRHFPLLKTFGQVEESVRVEVLHSTYSTDLKIFQIELKVENLTRSPETEQFIQYLNSRD